MFWGEYGTEGTGTIKKAAMDGSNQQILKNTGVVLPDGMQYDRLSIHFYFY